MKRLLIVNALYHPAVSPVLEVLSAAGGIQVIHAYEKNICPCVGCNA